MTEAGIQNIDEFSWITEEGTLQSIFRKAGLNIFDDIPEELKDKFQSEVTVVDDKYLNIGGTIDMLIKRASGKYAIRDFTFGSNFDSNTSSPIFRYGFTSNMTIMANSKNTKKLQMMWYAFIMRANDPTIEFEDLEVIYLPNRMKYNRYDSTSKVEVNDFLEMMYMYLSNEQPEVLEKMKADFITRYGQELGTKYYNSMFDGNKYDSGLTTRAKTLTEEKSLRDVLDEKLETLRSLTLFEFGLEEGDMYQTFYGLKQEKRQENKTEAIKVFKEVLDLLDNKDLQKTYRHPRDISYMSAWFSSNANQNSAYIQVYDDFLKQRKATANKRINEVMSTLKGLLKPVQQDYNRAHDK